MINNLKLSFKSLKEYYLSIPGWHPVEAESKLFAKLDKQLLEN